MTIKNTLQKTVLISTALVILSGTVNAQNISPAQRQEFTDAKTEVNNVLKAPYQKYAASELRQAQTSLQNAEATNDPTKYAQNARLARAQAQHAQAITELGVETDRLADTTQALTKARDDVAQLAKSK
jgi:hypothetical protein